MVEKEMGRMNIVLFAADAEENSLGRVYVLWMLAKELGWKVKVLAERGSKIWLPLAESSFSEDVILKKDRTTKSVVEEIIKEADLLIGCKPRPESAGVAISAGRRYSKPVLIDIDDPDFEFQFDSPLKKRARSWVTRPKRRLEYISLRNNLFNYPRFVSNPILQKTYGGTIIPHARDMKEYSDPAKSYTETLSIAFVGTVHPHKGIDDLRAAVAKLSPTHKVSLSITANKPEDAKPWERWLGNTSFEEGQRLVAQSDVIVIPSRNYGWGKAQLPAKLMDAMSAGKPVVVTDVGPLPWAVGDGGLVIPPEDADALVFALKEMSDPANRASFARKSFERARLLFSTESVAKDFHAACTSAAKIHQPQGT